MIDTPAVIAVHAQNLKTFWIVVLPEPGNESPASCFLTVLAATAVDVLKGEEAKSGFPAASAGRFRCSAVMR